ncbi:hypothetical protein BGX28_004785 [Mortierella sp. GBA30]|nr:hypothetical protein BGX28_004785 [Mortierella sp. GBA30]
MENEEGQKQDQDLSPGQDQRQDQQQHIQQQQEPQQGTTNSWSVRHMKCVVCMDFMEMAAMMRCGHVVCRECVLRIMSSHSRSCPICRAPLGASQPRILEFFVGGANDQATS